MTRMITPSEIEAAVHALIEARETNLGVEISMPVVYPNGQAVTVVVTVAEGDYVVHDAGLGAMYLTGSGMKVTKDMTRRLRNLAAQYGCEFIDSRMTRRCSVEHLAVAIALVANASRTVGDQAIELKRHAENDFRVAVSERLRSVVGRRLRENESVTGATGRKYRVGNVVLDRNEAKPIAFVAALANRSLVATCFTEFYDLRPLHPHVTNEVVYDEASGLRDEDRNLLQQVSEIVSFGESMKRFASLR